MSEDEMLISAQTYIDRMYVARCDARQKEMGLSYIEAERQDLARTLVKFANYVLSLSSADRSGGAT